MSPVCPKHMTHCAVGHVGRYSVSDTNGHKHNCCTALTVTSGFGVEDRAASVPEMQTKHKLMMARDFLGEIAGVLGKQKCMLNVVCALNSRSGICKVASIKCIGRVGAACVLFNLHVPCTE